MVLLVRRGFLPPVLRTEACRDWDVAVFYHLKLRAANIIQQEVGRTSQRIYSDSVTRVSCLSPEQTNEITFS